MQFIETKPINNKGKLFAKQNINEVDEHKTSFDQDFTIPISSKDNRGECKYCLIKQKLAPGLTKQCLMHSSNLASKYVKKHLNDYLPTVQQLTISSSKPKTQQLSIHTLLKQAQQIYRNTKIIQSFIHSHDIQAQNQIVLTLNRSIQLFKKEPFKIQQRDNNTSYTISLQLDVSNQITQWSRIPSQLDYPNLEQQGIKIMAYEYLNSLSSNCGMKKAHDRFLSFIQSVQQKFQFSHILIKQYQTSIAQLNKRLLTHIQKLPTTNNFKQLEDDLNFIQHISSLAQMPSRNISNNSSSLILKRKSFDQHQLDNDLYKLLVLQASALEKMLPQYQSEDLSTNH